MINSVSSTANSWLPPHNIVDSLNQVMDSVSVLSDVELQKELSIFANAQFTYDIAPGAAIDDDKCDQSNNIGESKQPNMHSLLNVKLASLVDNSYHTTMTPDAIESYYDQSPDCSPPNGYHSPNPSPPNGFHSPNPTPPNGYHVNSPAVFQGIVNPPITFYGEDAVMGYDEDQFMKTMRILTSSYNEQPQYDHMEKQQPSAPEITPKKAASSNTKKQRNNSISNGSVKKSSPLVRMELSTVEDDDEDDDLCDEDEGKRSQQPTLTKEDKRRRNTAASARFRVKKKMREQALQITANEMTEKAKAFESRVHELEREVKWLKALIVEKKDGHLEQMLMQQHQHQHQHQHQYRSAANLGRGSSSNSHYMSQHHLGQQQQNI